MPEQQYRRPTGVFFGTLHGTPILTGKEPPPLDLLMFQRGMPAPELAV